METEYQNIPSLLSPTPAPALSSFYSLCLLTVINSQHFVGQIKISGAEICSPVENSEYSQNISVNVLGGSGGVREVSVGVYFFMPDIGRYNKVRPP